MRITEQMKRLFGAMITAEYELSGKRHTLNNVVTANELRLDKRELPLRGLANPKSPDVAHSPSRALWTPQQKADAGKWYSHIEFTQRFYDEFHGGRGLARRGAPGLPRQRSRRSCCLPVRVQPFSGQCAQFTSTEKSLP